MDILIGKVVLRCFFEWNKWKNLLFNFSSQNISIECNFFKWDGKVTKISHLLFHRIWKNDFLVIFLWKNWILKFHFEISLISQFYVAHLETNLCYLITYLSGNSDQLFCWLIYPTERLRYNWSQRLARAIAFLITNAPCSMHQNQSNAWFWI